MSDESSPGRSPTAMEVRRLKSKRTQGTAIIIGIIVICVVGGTLAYLYLKPTPCELVTSDMCGFVDMHGEQCPNVEKALNDLGADEAWCTGVLEGKEDLEPEMISGHFLSALKTLLDPAIERHDAAGTEPPEILLKLLEKVDPSALMKRRMAAEQKNRPAADGGVDAADQDGGPDGGSE